VLLPLLPVILMFAYESWSRHAAAKQRQALMLAEDQYNARVAPLLKADSRFKWISSSYGVGIVTNSITPHGSVQSQTDLAALRTLMQSAGPPMPLDLRYVRVDPLVVPATQPLAELEALREQWRARREREEALEVAERAYNERVAPLLKREPRFRKVLVHSTTGWLMNRVQPFGFVETEADRVDLRKLLEKADPPMPLSFEYVFVTPERFSNTPAGTRPARGVGAP
jgi:hypothetical protein